MTRRLEHAPDVWEDFLCSTCRTFNVSHGNILLFKLQCLVHERQGAVTSNWVIGQGTFLLSARIFFSLSNPVADKPFHLSYINNLLKLQTFLARTPGNSCTKLSKMKEIVASFDRMRNFFNILSSISEFFKRYFIYFTLFSNYSITYFVTNRL